MSLRSGGSNFQNKKKKKRVGMARCTAQVLVVMMYAHNIIVSQEKHVPGSSRALRVMESRFL